jgi:VanZ family protein
MVKFVFVFVRALVRRIALWTPPIIYAALIFHFSSESNPLPALTTHVWDKLLHATEYAGFAVLLSRAFRGEGFGRARSILFALIVAIVYGASDEVHQLFTPGRDSSVLDWAADAVGAVVGSTLIPVPQVGATQVPPQSRTQG